MRRYLLARVLAAAQITLILLGWGAAQFPYWSSEQSRSTMRPRRR
ncbi:MAG: hypothetical protein U0Z44_16125 [Kouleothrix sp.]